MNDRPITLEDLIGLFRRNIFGIAISLLVCLELAALAGIYLPKKYKAKAVLNIQSSYFRSPLVAGLITEVTDPGELNSQRRSLLRLALNDQFLDDMGERYNVYQYPRENEQRIAERERLLNRIEYFSVTPTSFQISISGAKPRSVFEMTKEVLDQMTFTLIEERFRTLVKARDAIQSQVQFLSQALTDLNSPIQPQALQGELDRINEQIRQLRSKFTESHPAVFKLRQQAQSLQSSIKNAPPPSLDPEKDDMSKTFAMASSKQPVQEIYNDLLKKLSHLNIVLEMERDRESVSYLNIIERPTLPVRPFFPEMRHCLLIGLMAGIAIALLQTVFFELRRSVYLSSDEAADSLDLPLIGQLPPLGSEGLRMLEGSGRNILSLPAGGEG